MDIQEQNIAEPDTASRIRQIREAFAEARNKDASENAPKEPHSPTWNNWDNFHDWNRWNNSYT
jgi:hypothetical protein